MDIVRPPLSLIPFPYQVRNFTEHLASTPHPEFAQWNAENSLAIVWFGVNDVAAMQAYTKQATVTELVDRVMESYFDKIRILHREGLDRFVFMGVPRTSASNLTTWSDTTDGGTSTVSCPIRY